MGENTEEMKELCKSFLAEVEKAEKKNKAANVRARKISSRLGKVGIAFRRESIQFDKA